MVEKLETGATSTPGFWPRLTGDLQDVARKVAHFFTPESDASATTDCYEINVELPGISEDDIDLSVHDHVLTVKGEKHFEREEKGKTYFFSERAYGSFQRSFRLPSDAIGDRIEATFKNGLLTIRIPKATKQNEESRKIDIKLG